MTYAEVYRRAMEFRDGWSAPDPAWVSLAALAVAWGIHTRWWRVVRPTRPGVGRPC